MFKPSGRSLDASDKTTSEDTRSSKQHLPRERNLECFTINMMNPLTIKYFRSHVAVDNERKRHLDNFPYTIHPLSKFCHYYNAYSFFLYIILIIYKSYDFAFTRIKPQDPYSANFGILATGMIFDILAILNLILQCFIGYGEKDLTIELSLPKILLKNFLSGHFFCDLLSSIPRIGMVQANVFVFIIVNTMQLLKLRRITTIVSLTDPTFKLLNIKTPVKKFVIMFFLYVFMVIHFMTCVFIGVARYRFIFQALVPAMAAVYNRNAGKGSFANKYFWQRSKISQYLITFFKNVQYTMHIDIGDIRAATRFVVILEEQIVRVINYVVGKLLIAVIWIIMLYVFTSKMQLRTKFEQIMTELNQYMVAKQLPIDLKRRMISYYEYKYQNMFFNEYLMNTLLPENLKRDIDAFLYKSLIQQVSIFSQVSIRHLEQVISNLVPRIYLPGDLIIQSGTYGDCMYIIESGTVAVFSPSGKEICHLYDNAYFGEVSVLFKEKKRTASIVAIEISRLYELNKKAFNRCFKNRTNMKVYMSIMKLAKRRIKEADDNESFMKQEIIAAELA